MARRINFLELLYPDMQLDILKRLDDPADLVRFSATSCYWRYMVISNRLSKRLCLRKYPQLSVIPLEEPIDRTIRSLDVQSSNAMEWKTLERDHTVYAFLLQALTRLEVSPKDCIHKAVSASSTDHYPDESIVNTLGPRYLYSHRWGTATWWSSKGHESPDVSDTLIYKLEADICVITEIDIRPFKVFWEIGSPICSAKFVQFRMGQPKSPREIASVIRHLPLRQPADGKFNWTYTSPVFPMEEEDYLQQFKLPEPVLCIGGYLQIELLGCVQRATLDGLFYICINRVHVLGQPLYPAFDIKILDPSGEIVLKYYPQKFHLV